MISPSSFDDRTLRSNDSSCQNRWPVLCNSSLARFADTPFTNWVIKLGDLRPGRLGVDQKVNVIWHEDECNQPVKGPDLLTMPNRLGNTLGDSRLFEPIWPESCPIQLPIGRNESTSVAARGERESAVQTKRDEQGSSFRLKVREVATVFHLILVVRTARISPSWVANTD